MVVDQPADVLAIIIKCINFAAVKHKYQRRKDPEKTPYVNHVIGKKTRKQSNVWLRKIFEIEVFGYSRLRFCV
jgi:hypothetical protein